ncbi:TolB family protein [Autumnicola edwardsiae]|uniref:Biopolymer transporter TolR n=1 Tax=Autumnicola edwardsiae TaxID=3075594 RepID=A0ABU3CR71_9FLAO|nr:biopolymer transporter TolR [Zunongwangia sp. F297]MDT0648842.1 biopolymer transporter TolR [Zunongwangia sp. F297]
MNLKHAISALFSVFLFFSFHMAQAQQMGIFNNHQDIGDVKSEGSAEYNEEQQVYTLTGSGTNMWFGSDEFQYAWKAIQGDFILRARVEFVGEGEDPHRKIGWIVRNNLASDSPHVNATVHGDGLTSLQYRRQKGADTEEVTSTSEAPDVIQLERRGNLYIMSTAKFGEPFTSIEVEMDLRNEVFAGIYISAHNPDAVETAIFKNVRISYPAPEDLVPYTDYLGSRLEIMNVETGERKVLMTSGHSIQAPNWTRSGKLIYNSNGWLYNYDLETEKISMLNTGFAIDNNNDHVLSADENKIAISHHNPEDDGNSSIYYLPIDGSDQPVKVTKDGVGASYAHGWSPNGQSILFTGDRNGQYDIYQVDVESGKETQLTNTETLDDGSEFSRDGRHIYFNSNRTGAMQIWRMNADGSEQTQLTTDKFNDWFPHVSPDQEQLIFISFPEEIDSGDHPFYKRCLLRTMPIKGGEPKVVGYIYGGQGTINVPSWSPDGKYVAFVTNSDF